MQLYVHPERPSHPASEPSDKHAERLDSAQLLHSFDGDPVYPGLAAMSPPQRAFKVIYSTCRAIPFIKPQNQTRLTSGISSQDGNDPRGPLDTHDILVPPAQLVQAVHTYQALFLSFVCISLWVLCIGEKLASSNVLLAAWLCGEMAPVVNFGKGKGQARAQHPEVWGRREAASIPFQGTISRCLSRLPLLPPLPLPATPPTPSPFLWPVVISGLWLQPLVSQQCSRASSPRSLASEATHTCFPPATQAVPS